MFRLAIKNALARKVRLLSTASAVVMGVAFLAGTLVFTDTIQRTFDDLFADIYEDTDTYVRSEVAFDSEFGDSRRPRIDEDVVATIAAVDGVADAQGHVEGFAQVVGSDGDPVGNPGSGAPTFGMSFQTGPTSPWVVVDGREPGSGELVVDRHTADVGDLVVGDTVTVLTTSGAQEFPLVGIVRFGTADSAAGSSASLFDLPTAQALLAQPGQVDAIIVHADEGIGEEVLTERIRAVLPDGVEALTGSEITEEIQGEVEDALSFFNTFLLVFAGIALVVASFTIFNTFQIVVTQRTREMALMQAIGASSRQVLTSQLFEAAVIGVVASLLGLVAGVFVAGLLEGMLETLGIDIPAGGTVFRQRTAVVSVAVGLGVTIISAVFPSLRASRVPPLAALRDVSVDRSGRSRGRLVQGGAVTVAGLVALVAGLRGSGIELVGLGALLVFVGVFVLSPMIAGPVTRLVGVPVDRLAGVSGAIARENAGRNPKRTARTAGALMVGVALVAGITILAASVKGFIRDTFDEQFTGDYVVATDLFGLGGLSPQLADDLNGLPEVQAAAGIRVGLARVEDADGYDDTTYSAVDPETAGQVFDLGMVAGRVEDLTDGGVLVDDDEAADRGLVVGDQVSMTLFDGRSRFLTVQGIYEEQDLAGPFVVSHGLHEQSGADQYDFSVFVLTAPGVDDADARAAIAAVSDDYANAELQSRTEYIDDQAAQIDVFVNLIYGLLGLAVIIALFSIANTMTLSIHERTHELGLLRAVGMTRTQTRAMVRWETLLVALLGILLGLVIGVTFGWVVSASLLEGGVGAVTMPMRSIAVIVVVFLVLVGASAIRPARKAARIDILHAIATE
jgi:putative ABC transport system permease protein